MPPPDRTLFDWLVKLQREGKLAPDNWRLGLDRTADGKLYFYAETPDPDPEKKPKSQ